VSERESERERGRVSEGEGSMWELLAWDGLCSERERERERLREKEGDAGRE